MAITPKEALKKGESGLTEVVSALEKEIDAKLGGSQKLELQKGVVYNLPDSVSPSVAEALVRKYQGVGWNVERGEGDQRDPGKYLTFRCPRT